MKRTLLTLCTSALILGACSNETKKEAPSPSKTTQTTDINDTRQLIAAAKEKAKQVHSYASIYKNNVHEGKKSSNIDFRMKVDSKDNQEINIKNSAEKIKFYVYNKKTIMQQNGKWVDASTLVGTQLISQTEPLLYNAQFKLIDQLKDGAFKKASGYTLTETFNDYKKYKALFANTKENKKVINALEKEYPDIKGKIVVRFNESAELTTIDNQLKLSNDKTSIDNQATTEFTQINQIKQLNVPDEVKNAESVIESENNK